ncbi:MAG: hypothetical protein U9Q77_02760 [Candidatus Marinimicrobia bacterium]|nr:hypothetical protein [Candidatus Neomarinimicrobiota bacterium]
MNNIIKKSVMILILLTVGILGCKNNSIASNYTPNEFTLLVAASNHGEVGPCG